MLQGAGLRTDGWVSRWSSSQRRVRGERERTAMPVVAYEDDLTPRPVLKTEVGPPKEVLI
jgi:hypothetical protein